MRDISRYAAARSAFMARGGYAKSSWSLRAKLLPEFGRAGFCSSAAFKRR